MFLGLAPIYFKIFDGVDSSLIISYRVIFSFFSILPFFYIYRLKKTDVKKLDRFKIFFLMITGLLNGANWWVYVWAIDNNMTIEASLGYYISPILSIFLASIILKEKTSNLQKISIFIVIFSISTTFFLWMSFLGFQLYYR